MNSTLTANPSVAEPMAEPSAEEIARMRAELDEMYLEAEKTLARMDERRPEMDRLRAETEVVLDSIERMLRR